MTADTPPAREPGQDAVTEEARRIGREAVAVLYTPRRQVAVRAGDRDYLPEVSGAILGAAAALATTSAAVPDGWQLVPRELTLEMIEAAEAEFFGDEMVADAWSAMLAAAPPAPQPVEPEGRETWETIARWCEDTFGPVSPEQIARRAEEEMSELVSDPANVEEAADVLICLSRYPKLWEAVESKMKINRARQWRLMGDGTGYHIPAPPASAAPADEGRE